MLALLAGCSGRHAAPPASTAAQVAAPATSSATAGRVRESEEALPPPSAAPSWAVFKRQMAERLMRANPDGVYREKAPQVLLAVPVLQVELLASGHIRRILVLREPRQAKDTIELARRALYRAAPFGDMRRLRGPWVFTESFLFDERRRFKPRTLD